MRAVTDGRGADQAHTDPVEIILLIAAAILLIPPLFIWLDDERDHVGPKSSS